MPNVSAPVTTDVDQVLITPNWRKLGPAARANPVDVLRFLAPSPALLSDARAVTNTSQEGAESGSQTQHAALVEKARVQAVRNLERDRPTLSITSRVAGMRRWNGRVIETDDEFVTAELAPWADENLENPVTADFPTHLFGTDEVVAGDALYVTSREVVGIGKRRSTTTSVRLRRLGKWTSSDLESIRDRAEKQAFDLAKYVR